MLYNCIFNSDNNDSILTSNVNTSFLVTKQNNDTVKDIGFLLLKIILFQNTLFEKKITILFPIYSLNSTKPSVICGETFSDI